MHNPYSCLVCASLLTPPQQPLSSRLESKDATRSSPKKPRQMDDSADEEEGRAFLDQDQGERTGKYMCGVLVSYGHCSLLKERGLTSQVKKLEWPLKRI